MKTRFAIAPLIALALSVPAACTDSSNPLGDDAIDFLVLAMDSDLTRLATAQAAYHTAHGSYTVLRSDLSASLPQWPTPGVNISIGYATAASWGATAESPVTSRRCAIYVGTAPSTPLVPGLTLAAGVAGCEP